MKFRPLSSWLTEKSTLSPNSFYLNDEITLSMGVFIALDVAIDLHLANTIVTGTLENSWEENQSYIKKVCEIVNADRDNSFDLDGEEKLIILEELGEPPESSYNIYFITIYYNEFEERVVYIGKTNSKIGRFSNGHSAALKLHDPKYSSYKKRVYFGTITLLSKDGEYVPLEFITPFSKAKRYLNGTEAFLIHCLKPELNIHMENMGEFREVSLIHIQNFSEEPNFMKDKIIFQAQ